MLPKEAIANVEQIRGLVHEVNILRAALDEVRSMAESGMGEWSSVQPPYLPAEMEVLHDIVAACDEAVEQCVHPTRLAVGTDGESDKSAGG